MHTPSPRPQSGFTLIESLIATVVVAFGMMAVVGMQLHLARSADLAKQRGEASRLAEERMEFMRSYTAINTTAGQLAWADLANGSDTVTSNATFNRAWTVDGAASAPMRRVTVNVGWVDRSNLAQTVQLTSVISKTDPADPGSLGFPLPQNTTLKRPKNRSLNIPVPATDLGNGQSVHQLANNFAVVFNNDSGYVVKKCNFVVTSATQLKDCTTYDAYILAGYVSKTMSAFPSALGLNTASLTGYDTAAERGVQCTFGDAKDQNDPNATLAGYKYYLCVVSVTKGQTWAGTLRLSGMASGTNYKVCRFQYPASGGGSANLRNVQPYVAVNESLDNQNYVITTNNNCPTLDGLATTEHQVCTSGNTNRATDCPAS